MDFNIDNETFANAYKCLQDANGLLEEGLGNFSELDGSALLLIEKGDINNNDRLDDMTIDCSELKDKMYRTIESLAAIDEESALYFEDILKYGFEDSDFENEDVEITSYDAVSADGIKYKVDIVGEVDENTTIILVNHGAGGSYKALDSFLENEEIAKGNAIIIRYPLDGKSDKAYKLMEEVSSKYNIPIQNCTTAGFSAGGKQAIKQMADLVAAHPEIKQPVVMLIDAYDASAKVSSDELRSLGDSGAILFSVQREGVDQEYINYDEWSNQYGINFVKISDNQCKTTADPHKAVFTDYFESGLFNYQVGNGKFQVDEIIARNGEMINNYGNARVYNSETGEWDSIDINNKSLNETYKTLGYNYSEGELPVVSLSADEFLEGEDTILADNSNTQPKNNTLIAHRGYSPGGITDNSRESFILAGQSGYWGCETDVRFDSNGNLVCSHNSVKTDQNPVPFDEYLDICAEYGMTPVIDLKYENGTEVLDPNLSTAILKAVEDKGMLNTSVLQTNNAKDVAYIRENSDDARIWYLKDVISDNDMQLIQDNGVECVNIKSSEDKNLYRIKNLSENGVDVCVWNVQSEQYKNALINNGASYVMTDYAFDVTPYQEGDVDFNSVAKKQNDDSASVVSLSTDPTTLSSETAEEITKSEDKQTTVSNYNNWQGTVLTAQMGRNNDGPSGSETWYPDAPIGALNFLKEKGFTDLEMSVREDGVRILSGKRPTGETFKDLVVVAADVEHPSNPDATYQRGDVVETSLGTGMVVDYCEQAVGERKYKGNNHFDIATAWHTGEYMANAYGTGENNASAENVEQIVSDKTLEL